MKLLFVKFPFGTEMRMSQQNHEGGWSGIGMATVGIHPNDFDLYPNKIPPGRVVISRHHSEQMFQMGQFSGGEIHPVYLNIVRS